METSMPPLETPTAPQPPGENAGSLSSKRKRQPRNSACQPCASLKMKCVEFETGKCERCNRMGRECIPAVPKPRKRKAEGDVGISSVSGQPLPRLEERGTTTATSTTGEFRSSQIKSPFDAQTPLDSLLSRPDIRHTGSQSFAALFAQGLKFGSSPATSEDMLQNIDYNYVQNSLTVFRQFSQHFPFVQIPLDQDAVSLVAQRPLMAAAICMVAAADKPAMQNNLSLVVRQALATKAIVEGERSVDLLVGLLIYLAWHHHYMSEQQTYQHLCLLSGIAAELGLYRQSRREDIGNIVSELERDRALLGCYYLCSGLSTKAFNKPCPMRWTDNLRRCAENVARNGGASSDRSLLPILELTRAVQDFEDALQSGLSLKRAALDQFVEMHTKAASHRLKALKREHSALASNLGFAAATIDVYHKLLVANDPPDTSTLIQCACTIKDYIDDVLARPPITLHQIAIVDWTNLLEILMLMAKVSKPLPSSAGWDAGALNSMLQPDHILDTMCGHMASATTDDILTPRNEHLLQWLRNFCDSIKRRIVHDQHGSGNAFTSRNLPGEPPAGVHSHFRPVDNSAGSVTELSLPYQVETGLGTSSSSAHGILEEGFLDNFMGVR